MPASSASMFSIFFLCRLSHNLKSIAYVKRKFGTGKYLICMWSLRFAECPALEKNICMHILEFSNGKSGSEYEDCKTLFVQFGKKDENFRKTIYKAKEDNLEIKTFDARMILLDFIGEYFHDYFAGSRNTFVTIDWSEFSVENIKFYARGQVFNKKLESLADDVLNSAGYDADGSDRLNKK